MTLTPPCITGFRSLCTQPCGDSLKPRAIIGGFPIPREQQRQYICQANVWNAPVLQNRKQYQKTKRHMEQTYAHTVMKKDSCIEIRKAVPILYFLLGFTAVFFAGSLLAFSFFSAPFFADLRQAPVGHTSTQAQISVHFSGCARTDFSSLSISRALLGQACTQAWQPMQVSLSISGGIRHHLPIHLCDDTSIIDHLIRLSLLRE